MLRKAILVLVGFALLVTLWLFHAGINAVKEGADLAETSPFRELPPGEFAGTLLMGGFRAIAVNLLWMRATDLLQQREWHELMALYELISHLQPHFEEVWSFNAWNLAFNIPHYIDEPEGRWKWVREAFRFLDKGLLHNPRSAKLMFMKGWIFSVRIPQEEYLEKRVFEEFGKDCYELAVEWYGKAVAQEGRTRLHELSYYQSLRELGLRREMQGRLEETLAAWREARWYRDERMSARLCPEERMWLDAIMKGVELAARAEATEEQGEKHIDVARLYMGYIANSDLTLERFRTYNPAFVSERREYAGLKAFLHLCDAADEEARAGRDADALRYRQQALDVLSHVMSRKSFQEPNDEYCTLLEQALEKLGKLSEKPCMMSPGIIRAVHLLEFELAYRLLIQNEGAERHAEALKYLAMVKEKLARILGSEYSSDHLDALELAIEVEALGAESLSRGEVRKARRYYFRALGEFRALQAMYEDDHLSFSRFVSLKKMLRRKDLR